MLKRSIALIACGVFSLTNFLSAQDDPVLFELNKTKVHASEFMYSYNKQNSAKADYSESSLKEHLDLYINFKLQVEEGMAMGLDKNPAVKNEQNQYKRQLASTYLTDREITEKLVKEAYERNKEDRRLQHIFIAVPATASEQEKRDVYKRAQEIKAKATAANFADLAKQYSDDIYSKEKGGDLGFYTALQQLPYALETALYATPKGSISNIVATKYGYHIVYVADVRSAKGSMKAGHILFRTKKNPDRAKHLVDSIHTLVMGGASFEKLAKEFSQDNETKNRGGQLGWVTINKYDQDLEDKIFSLAKDGNISKPVKTTSGWHIIKRYQQIQNPAYKDVKTEITNKIKRSPRFKLIQNAMVAEIKKEANYTVDAANKKALIESLKKDASFISYSWTAKKELLRDQRVLFKVGNVSASFGEFFSLAQRSYQERMSMQPKTLEAAVDRIIEKLAVKKCLAYEETQLEQKYPEFKALLREYEEGILLFEVKKQLIWDKASADEEGLAKFYEANKSNYKWSERASVTFYTVRSDDKKQLKKIKKKAKRKSEEEVKAMFNSDAEVVHTTAGTYEKGKNMELDQMKWKKNTVSKGYTKAGSTYFTKIEAILPSSVKTLDEAKGYVVADYQNEIEAALIKSLKEKFTVSINDVTLKQMVK